MYFVNFILNPNVNLFSFGICFISFQIRNTKQLKQLYVLNTIVWKQCGDKNGWSLFAIHVSITCECNTGNIFRLHWFSKFAEHTHLLAMHWAYAGLCTHDIDGLTYAAYIGVSNDAMINFGSRAFQCLGHLAIWIWALQSIIINDI